MLESRRSILDHGQGRMLQTGFVLLRSGTDLSSPCPVRTRLQTPLLSSGLCTTLRRSLPRSRVVVCLLRYPLLLLPRYDVWVLCPTATMPRVTRHESSSSRQTSHVSVDEETAWCRCMHSGNNTSYVLMKTFHAHTDTQEEPNSNSRFRCVWLLLPIAGGRREATTSLVCCTCCVLLVAGQPFMRSDSGVVPRTYSLVHHHHHHHHPCCTDSGRPNNIGADAFVVHRS